MTVNFEGGFIDGPLEKFLFHSNPAVLDHSVLTDLAGESKDSAIASCTWDVDFVCVYGELHELFADTDVAELLGNSSGKALSLCCIQNIRTELFGRMLMFAKAGDWLIGRGFLFRGAN